jgi:tetratricopeptide (TPR) repeat protein/predicted Ser/Thr protein kinase
MIGKIISHYKILEKLGEGGMGVVYKAQDIKLDRLVALKFLPPHLTSEFEEKERFIHEAKAASALNHTNITTIYEIDEFEGQMFIVMEYVEGKTLKQIIEKETLPIKKALDIGIQICEGLAMAHEKGIVHRDIKSDNIMLTPRGQVKIMDFGLAKLKGATKLTKTRSTLGTLAYMSPEQAQGEEVDSRSDIFSFGVVLYELLTKNLPFGGEHQAAIVYSIINEEPQPVARFNNQVSAELERIVFKALSKDREERYQHADEVLADLRKERKSLDYLKTGQVPKEAIAAKPKRKVLPIAIPASVAFILVLLFLILRPFKFEIAPEKGAVAKESSLAIMYFENMVDREDKGRLGEIVTNLLITSLSESQYMRVISSQRLYDILKLMGKEGAKVIDKNVASEVANKANAKWMVLGGIVQVEPRMVITTQLVDVKSGQVIASQRIMAQPKQDIFSLVDTLALGIKKDLSLPEQAQKETIRPVADVTTRSPEAYRYYLEGLDYGHKLYSTEAQKSLEKALEFDSTFAMAYCRLAELKEGEEEKRLTAKAVKYSGKASQKERDYIKGWETYVSGNYSQAVKELKKMAERYPDEKEAFYTLGFIYYQNLRQYQEAVHYFNQAIQIDPLYKLAYNQLAYAYNDMGEFDKSIRAIDKYIELGPDEANPYDSRADLYAWNGKLGQAIDSYKKALEIKPDFFMSLSKLGHMYLFQRNYVKAESCYKELASSSDKNTRSQGRFYLALIPAYQGKFEDALRILDDGIAADRMDQAEGFWNVQKHWEKASVYDAKQNLRLALEETKIIIEINKRVYPNIPVNGLDLYAYLLAKSGKLKEAEQICEVLKKDIEAKSPALIYDYWLTLGTVELAQDNAKTAVTYLEKAEKEGPPLVVGRFFLGQAYLDLGRLSEAVVLLEQALSRYDEVRARQQIYAVKCYYLLGLAYEKSGWKDKAIQQYQEFLDIWKNADPGIPEVTDAKERLQRLKGRT